MANQLKLTKPIVALLAERKKAGFSYRELAAWLSATHGVEVSYTRIRQALISDAAAPSKPVTTKPVTTKTATPSKSVTQPDEHDDGPAGGSDEVDRALLDRAIANLESDVESARSNCAGQSLAMLQRLLLDAVQRRRALRPPVAASDGLDAECMAAGARAEARFAALVDEALEGRS